MKTFDERVAECKRLQELKIELPPYGKQNRNNHHIIDSQCRVIGNELSLSAIHDAVIEDELEPYEERAMKQAYIWLTHGIIRKDGRDFTSIADIWQAYLNYLTGGVSK